MKCLQATLLIKIE